jgi:hypothetical protein
MGEHATARTGEQNLVAMLPHARMLWPQSRTQPCPYIRNMYDSIPTAFLKKKKKERENMRIALMRTNITHCTKYISLRNPQNVRREIFCCWLSFPCLSPIHCNLHKTRKYIININRNVSHNFFRIRTTENKRLYIYKHGNIQGQPA